MKRSSSSRLDIAKIRSFRRVIFQFYKKHGRDLPWRHTTDPYRITISEFMLQQTQVSRVVPKYEAWIKRWPSWRTLSKASGRELLAAWSGLGYNRRALFLGKLARAVIDQHKGVLPDNAIALQKLPGIGPYTAKSILIFSHNAPLATVDTNIRRVLIHAFSLSEKISDEKLYAVAEQVLHKRRSRDWHNALMDYGALVQTSSRTGIAAKNRQSRFEGSPRQIRGALIRHLLENNSTTATSFKELWSGREDQVDLVIAGMVAEKLITIRRQRITLVDR